MASTSKIQLTASGGGLLNLPGITPETATAVSEALNDNHNTHHIFFNAAEGFHNHIAHNLLATYDLGAPASILKSGYARESQYQRDLSKVPLPTEKINLHDPSEWKKYLGEDGAYVAFLNYFKSEIDKHGYEEVVNRTLFAGDDRANDMLVRMFAGFLHSFIHIGYGLEFRQPAIVAEGLSMAAMEPNWLGALLLKVEEAAKAAGEDTSDRTLVELMNQIRGDEKLRTAPLWSDGNKIRGIIERAPEEMVGYARQYKVTEAKLHEKMAECMNAAALYAAAAQRPDKQYKIDFYYMHGHNSSIFLPVFLGQPWISTANKVRLLEWKGRMDLALYASRRAPELRVDDIRNYVPKEKASGNPWFNIIDRALKFEDDGHTAKFIRECIKGEKVCAEYQDHEDTGFVVKGDMWIKIAQICIDSVEEKEGLQWVRSAGFDEAWEKYGPRKQY